MDKLKNELRSGLLANPDVSIVNDALWQLPIVTYAVSFGRVKRFKMDILMKMLLLSFQEAEIRRAAALADMLLVEELFVRDLIEKMERRQLVQLEKKGYGLTAKGYEYLEKGIFEEEMEGDETLVSFSAVHDEYVLATNHSSLEAGDKLSPYRYASGRGTLKKERIQQLLTEEMVYAEEENVQIMITEVTACIEQETRYVPCLEFQLYDSKQDIFYARVWNTMTGSWDEKLAKQIEEREVMKWRKAMEERKAALVEG